MLDTALAAIVNGWAVFPLRPADKRPAVDRWEERATTDLDGVCDYWQAHPDANVGIACGPARPLVVDLDVKGDVDGIASFVLDVIPAPHELPDTYAVETVSGGLHVYFATSDGDDFHNTAGKLGPGVDTRARGGYVVAAGSQTATGTYRTVVDVDPVPVPAWLARRLTEPKPRPETVHAPTLPNGRHPTYSGLVAAVATATEGTRNHVLHWAACRLVEHRQRGEPVADAFDQIHLAATTAGLTDTEATATIRSALRQAGL
jgi:hypothetical protein